MYKLKTTESKNKKNKIIKITRKENCFQTISFICTFKKIKIIIKKRTSQSH